MPLANNFRTKSGLGYLGSYEEMIRRGALVSISTSGVKDSQAMTILLARIVPRDQLVAVHAPLGEVEWPGTIEHIAATLPRDVPLILAPVASGKSLLQRIEERGRFPSSNARYLPGLPEKARDWQAVTERIKDGEKLVRACYSVPAWQNGNP